MIGNRVPIEKITKVYCQVLDLGTGNPKLLENPQLVVSKVNEKEVGKGVWAKTKNRPNILPGMVLAQYSGTHTVDSIDDVFKNNEVAQNFKLSLGKCDSNLG